jgi:hypothetical protein
MSLYEIFAAAFAFIALKAFQQINVTRHHPVLVMPTSFAMAAVEIGLVVEYARSGFDWHTIAVVGLGSGLGCLFSMYLHRWMRR